MRALAGNGAARVMRERARISLREAAQALKVSPSTLSRWETGETTPPTQAALKWARLLDELAGEPA